MEGYTVTWLDKKINKKDYVRANSCKKALKLFTICYGLRDVVKIELS
jgi:hypothetical protein